MAKGGAGGRQSGGIGSDWKHGPRGPFIFRLREFFATSAISFLLLSVAEQTAGGSYRCLGRRRGAEAGKPEARFYCCGAKYPRRARTW